MKAFGSRLNSFSRAHQQAEDIEARCLIGQGESCASKPIDAHSVQRAKLRLIADKRKRVLILTPDFNKVAMWARRQQHPSNWDEVFEFRSISNRLMTAKMACSGHDNQTFAPIEDRLIDPNDTEHCLLLTYKSVLQYLYAKRVVDRMFKLLAQGDPLFRPLVGRWSPEIIAATRLKKLVEEDITAQQSANQITGLQHRVITFPSKPSVAGTGVILRDGHDLFTPRELAEVRQLGILRSTSEVPFVLTVYPESNHTVAIVSFPRGRESMASVIVPALKEENPERASALLSKILLDEVENIMVSPTVWRSFGNAKQKRIFEQFMGTLPPPLPMPVPPGAMAVDETALVERAYAHEPDFIASCDPGELNLFAMGELPGDP